MCSTVSHVGPSHEKLRPDTSAASNMCRNAEMHRRAKLCVRIGESTVETHASTYKSRVILGHGPSHSRTSHAVRTTSKNDRDYDLNSALSQSNFRRSKAPAQWSVPHRVATIKHRKTNGHTWLPRMVEAHGKHSLNVLCNHVEQHGAWTATQQQTCEGAKDLVNTHGTHCRSRMRTHTCTTRHAKPNMKTKCRIKQNTQHMAHLRTKWP